MENEKQTSDPIRQSVHIEGTVEEAFHLFTESFEEWWPGNEDESEAMREGQVTVWDPPQRIEFVWRRGPGETVSLEFHAEGTGTRVMVTHTGWQHAGQPVCLSGMALAA
jgi:activator of Hsp90 ATPase-like protein